MSSKFIYVVACVGISFLLRLNNILLYVCATLCLPICWWALGLLLPFGYCELCCCEHGVQTPLWNSTFNSFVYMFRSWIAGSRGNSTLNFLRKFHTIFHSGCTILLSHQQCTRILLSLPPCQHLSFSVLRIIAIMGMKWTVLFLKHFYIFTSTNTYNFKCLYEMNVEEVNFVSK